ncbi:hypothetical protein SAMN05660330_02766 [Desulforhopalus singaporensis]|uniref:Uncharacterized protein n=1 Tax=Desulforhopalus singaporensis TaxID=91360 RepID=A0A1H0SQ84_9BACT|nr:hypothetical protein SAMN05660330_02766 [Desulforhopalus singaporensis]
MGAAKGEGPGGTHRQPDLALCYCGFAVPSCCESTLDFELIALMIARPLSRYI